MHKRLIDRYGIEKTFQIYLLLLKIVIIVPTFFLNQYLFGNMKYSYYESLLSSVFMCILILIVINHSTLITERQTKRQIANRVGLDLFLSLLASCTVMLPYRILENREIAGFFSILATSILLSICANIFKYSPFKILLNIMRFLLILLTTISSFGRLDYPNLEYADKAVLASLIFDTIINNVNFTNAKGWLMPKHVQKKSNTKYDIIEQ